MTLSMSIVHKRLKTLYCFFSIGMALDLILRHLYFTNMGSSEPGSDGVIYSFSRVEMISLDRNIRKTIIRYIDNPRALEIDNESG